MKKASIVPQMSLGAFLIPLQKSYHRAQYLDSDPLEYVHHFQDSWDQEVVAILAAVLAYGKVAQIRKSISDALRRIHKHSSGPAQFVRKIQNPAEFKKAQKLFEGYVHRFNVGEDLVCLFWLIGRSWSHYGSVGSHFLQYLEPNAEDFSAGLDQLFADWKDWLRQAQKTQGAPQAAPTFNYLLTAPGDGSCCKRWCMLLRWMGRKDELDLGLWGKTSPLSKTFPKGKFLKASQLVMPLDTHTGRISQYLGLTHRKSLNWKAAVEVTDALRKVDALDPTRFDFALSRLGILDICQRSYRKEICQKCQLLPACQLAQKSLPKIPRLIKTVPRKECLK